MLSASAQGDLVEIAGRCFSGFNRRIYLSD
jgi:hypothetical protein